MAGPLTSEEIEDVVSSVRRLVSNEQSPRRLSRDLNAERLLLTPSLRVVSETSPLAPLILEAQMPDPAPVAPVPDAPAAEVLPGAVPEDAVDLIEAEWEDEIWAPAEALPLGEAALAADEAEVLLPPAHALPEAFAPEPDADDLPEAWAEVDADLAGEEPVPFVPLRRRAETLAAKLAAGEVADTLTVGGAPSDADHAGAGDVDPTLYENLVLADMPVAEGRPDRSEADRAEPGKPDAQRIQTELLDADGTPLAVLDEAALQEIVRQMIREELQGTLGERITRNVRKLVRAEINRALMARDLD